MGYGTMGRNVVKLIIPILEGAEVKFVHEHFSNHNEKGTQQAHFMVCAEINPCSPRASYIIGWFLRTELELVRNK